jgi:uncharacterized protein (TIGR00255 family)
MPRETTSEIRSMTGFGAGSAEAAAATARVEIRSVNHRGIKLTVRSRPPLGPLEKELRDLAGAELRRGSVDVYVTLTRLEGEDLVTVREGVARQAVSAVRRVAADLGLGGELEIGDLLRVPGLLEEETELPVTEEEWPLLEQAAREAVEQVVSMRRAEGTTLTGHLRELTGAIESFAVEARRQAPTVVERVRERLRSRLEEIRTSGLLEADEQGLEREICFHADRADITEELDRLHSHLDQFRGLLDAGGEVGKRLEFLAQEFLREINTAASKASDGAIVHAAVEAKQAVEKIKEQAANVE